ncbi:hypothetical protein BU16DRAFT_64510 [Lophium mytilinum]|uniref:Uncharacterized protein n=1 Tax=Lophium mytilinum TaxID=390894 RepID=A0A6A6QNL5_9PEZI|nr:hypothetical protein BU16DRAFT_64510 [Lophium mytilinum]
MSSSSGSKAADLTRTRRRASDEIAEAQPLPERSSTTPSPPRAVPSHRKPPVKSKRTAIAGCMTGPQGQRGVRSGLVPSPIPSASLPRVSTCPSSPSCGSQACCTSSRSSTSSLRRTNGNAQRAMLCVRGLKTLLATLWQRAGSLVRLGAFRSNFC